MSALLLTVLNLWNADEVPGSDWMSALTVTNVVEAVRVPETPLENYQFGLEDDSAVIQSVIDSLDPLNPGILYFPQGTYLILGGPLQLERFEGLWIQGAGTATVLDGQ